MRVETYELLGLDTLQFVDVGYGPPYHELWTRIEQHPGPAMMMEVLGGSRFTTRFLYPQHLELLYDRFRQANPTGIWFGSHNRLEHDYAQKRGMTLKQLDDIYGNTDCFKCLTSTDEHLGYPLLRPYLPELYEPEAVKAMESDPWLDDLLLKKAIQHGFVPDSHERHPRWSPEWRAYCDALGGQFPAGWKNAGGGKSSW